MAAFYALSTNFLNLAFINFTLFLSSSSQTQKPSAHAFLHSTCSFGRLHSQPSHADWKSDTAEVHVSFSISLLTTHFPQPLLNIISTDAHLLFLLSPTAHQAWCVGVAGDTLRVAQDPSETRAVMGVKSRGQPLRTHHVRREQAAWQRFSGDG